MKHSVVSLFLAGAILLLMAAVPVTATSATISGDAISSLYPSVGYADGKTVTYTVTGVNFTTVSGEVTLMKSGENNISATITSWSSNTIVCKMKITSSKEPGTWDLVVVKSYDGTEIVKSDALTITGPITLTSITPASGQVDDDNVDFTLVGTNFDQDEDQAEEVFLYNGDYDNITADFDIDSSTKITGTFDLTDAEDDTYDVCVKDSFGTVLCDLAFEITTNEVGSIDIASSPSGATIYVDGIANGTTPATVDDVIAGSHKIILRKTGYEDWGKIVNIEDGETSEIDATLYALATATPALTTSPITIPATQPATVRTTVRSTIKVPTTWADTTAATTAASPVDPAVVIGAAGIGIGFAVLRRR